VDRLTVSLAAFASLVALIFALVTADRWHRRRLSHHGAWAMAMSLFFLGSFALWWATAAGWSNLTFRVFFTAGAVLNVAWLSLGSIALLAGDRIARPVRAALALLSTFAIGVMVVAPTTAPFVADEFPRARDHFGMLPRLMAAIGSGIPAAVIIIGALWSIVRLLTGRTPAVGTARRTNLVSARRLVASNVLIAIGTVVLSGSGSLAGRLGEERAFTVTLSIGVVILFLGFLAPSAGGGSDLRAASTKFSSQHLARRANG
jgi:MFS family permease